MRRKIIFLVTAALMLFGFLMSSTDLFIKEDVAEIKKISVYVASKESSYTADLKRGIFEIANEGRVDVNYDVLPDSSTRGYFLQMEHEYESGSQAVILFSEDPGSIRSLLQKDGENWRMVTVNAFDNGRKDIPDVSFDVKEAAVELANEVQQEYGDSRNIMLLTGGGISDEIGRVLQEVFLEKGIETDCIEATEQKIMECRNRQEAPVFIGCWITETEAALEYMEKDTLYGVGYSDKILKGIREGDVKGAAAFSMYGVGIHAIQQAVAVIEKEKAQDILVPCRMVTKENIDEQKEFLIPIH